MSIWSSVGVGEPDIYETPSMYTDGCGHRRQLGVARTTMTPDGEEVRLSVDCDTCHTEQDLILSITAARRLRDWLDEALTDLARVDALMREQRTAPRIWPEDCGQHDPAGAWNICGRCYRRIKDGQPECAYGGCYRPCIGYDNGLPYCEPHLPLRCCSCGEKATRDCACDQPLCHRCGDVTGQHDHQRRYPEAGPFPEGDSGPPSAAC